MYGKKGWPNTLSDIFSAYKQRQNELYIENDCIIWGRRVVIPLSLRNQLLRELHIAHAGMCKMKALARAYNIWWPN